MENREETLKNIAERVSKLSGDEPETITGGLNELGDEDLEKINDGFNELSDEELERIAGGNCAEMAADSRFLNSLTHSIPRYTKAECLAGIFNRKVIEDIKLTWRSLGVVCELSTTFFSNKYYIDGREVSQDFARQWVMYTFDRHMSEEEWNY